MLLLTLSSNFWTESGLSARCATTGTQMMISASPVAARAYAILLHLHFGEDSFLPGQTARKRTTPKASKAMLSTDADSPNPMVTGKNSSG